MVDETYQPKTYRKDGGDAHIIASGGYLDVEAGGELRIGGTAITATAAEINAIAGGGLSEAELGVLNSVTAGVAAASKALVLSAAAALAWTFTSASVDGGASVEPLALNTTLTGIGGVGGRAKFSMTTEVALGGWANALKGITDFGTAGRVTGLGSAVVAEMLMGPGTTEGTYAPLEIELGIPSGASMGTATSFLYMSANDTPAAFDTSGFLFNIAGLTANSGKLFNSGLSQVVTAAARLRVKVGATTYYIPLCAAEALTS
jgi:hypothetical protein